MKKLFFFWLIIFLLLPAFSFAQECPDCSIPGGLVPCGRRCDDPTTVDINECDPCNLCHFFILADKIVDIFLAVTTSVLIILIIALIIITAYVRRGATGALQGAKKALTGVVIGLILLYSSWVIVNTVLMVLGVTEWSGFTNWWTIECPEPRSFEAPEPRRTYCGDNIIQRPNSEGLTEACDGLALDKQDCESQGYDQGALKCLDDCSGLDASGCWNIDFNPPLLPEPPPLSPIPPPAPLGPEDDSFCTLCGFESESFNLEGYCEQDACLGLGECNWVPIELFTGAIGGMCVYPNDCDYCGQPFSDDCLNAECRAIGGACRYVFDEASVDKGGVCVDPDLNQCYRCRELPLGCTQQACERMGLRCNFVSGNCILGEEREDGCTPHTCPELNFECGLQDDGCEGTLDCGSCPDGSTCQGGRCEGGAVCPDGACNGTETCSTCPEDCGECAAGGIYYLNASTGDDNNSGLSPDQAWRTLSRAMLSYGGAGNRVTWGDTVMMYNGNYGGFSLSPDYLNLAPGAVSDPLPASQEWIAYRAVAGQNNIVMTGLSFHLTSSNTDLYAIAHEFDGINFSCSANCVYVFGGKGLTIRNSNLTASKDAGVLSGDPTGHINIYFRTWTGDINIINNTIQGGYRGISVNNAHNITIRGNDIFDIGVDKIIHGGGGNITIENNDLHGPAILPSEHPDLIQFYTATDRFPGASATNVVIRNNRMYNHPSQGLWTGGSLLKNVIFTGNLIYNLGNYEWRVQGVHGGVFANNTIVADRTAGQIGVIFYGGYVDFLEDINCKDIEVRDNIFAAMYWGDPSVMSFHDRNIFSKEGGVSSPGDSEPNSLEYSDRFQTISNVFVDPGSSDFHPRMSSPACNGSLNGSPGVAIGALPCR